MHSSHINNYVFHFNVHTQIWSAIPREHYKEYWNNHESPHILKSSQIETLIEILDRISRVKKLSELLTKS